MKPGVDYIGVGCGALIVNDEGETLFLKRAPKGRNEAGFWSKPGGTVRFGETIKQAIMREIKEEFGVEVKLLDCLGYTDHFIPAEKQHWVAISYLAKIIKGEPKNLEPEKSLEMKWFKLDKLPKNLTQTTSESIKEYLKILNKSIDF